MRTNVTNMSFPFICLCKVAGKGNTAKISILIGDALTGHCSLEQTLLYKKSTPILPIEQSDLLKLWKQKVKCVVEGTRT